MNIAYWDFNFDTSSIDIYLSGCKAPHCPGCHNSELLDFEAGKPYEASIDSICQRLEMYEGVIDNISLVGGEPLDQDLNELFNLVAWLDSAKAEDTKLWLYTKYSLKEVPKVFLKLFDYIKCGRYLEEKKGNMKRQYGVKLASTNQKIYKRGVDFDV